MVGPTPHVSFFSDFDLCHVTEAGKVENYRFLANVTYNFEQKLELRVILDALSDAIQNFRFKPVMSGNSKIIGFTYIKDRNVRFLAVF